MNHVRNKDYSQIFKILSMILEESNALIFNEGLKVLKLLIFVMGSKFPLAKLKHFIILITKKVNFN
jgi:hypothetical protein